MTKLPQGPRWIAGYGVAEAMDVTGLDGREASRLALTLAQWNLRHQSRGYVSIYARRDGKRYMNIPLNLRVDLNHPVMAPFVHDILAAAEDQYSAREFEHEGEYLDAEEWAATTFAAAYEEYLQVRQEHGLE